jgi:AcrR family transcriptional regulator
MSVSLGSGRANQKLRTRQALLSAARDLLGREQIPTFDEVAEAAMVSRATAYRYFPSIEALLAETVLDAAFPDPQEAIGDREQLLDRVLAAVSGATTVLLDNEIATHALAKSLADRWLNAPDGDARARPARRLLLIDAALEPHVDRLGVEVAERLRRGLALVCGMEAAISARDVVGLDREEATAAVAWAATALVAAAEHEASASSGRRS